MNPAIPQPLRRRYLRAAEFSRARGARIQIHYDRPSILIDGSDGIDLNVHDAEARALLNAVPENMFEQDYLLARVTLP